MKERMWLSNLSLDDVRGGTELLGTQFCRAMGLKYFSASKFGIPLYGSNADIAELLDKKLDEIDIELLVYNSVNCWSKKPKADLAIAVCCENFREESESLDEPSFSRLKMGEFEFQKKSLKNADKIVTISEQEKESFEKDGFTSTLIEPYVDLERFRPTGESKNPKMTALFVGRSHPRKGFDIVLELEKRFPQIAFWYVVDGSISSEELNSLYNRADFLLMPSRYESFGFVYAEALATNLPIISSRVGLFGKWQPSEFGIFPSEITVEAFSEAIKSFDPKNFEDSRPVAEERFSFERFKEECDDLLGNGQ